ncbi:Bug family tripartite tricarboxylate transporter substrate binding protein [Achromobacter aloeverae]
MTFTKEIPGAASAGRRRFIGSAACLAATVFASGVRASTGYPAQKPIRLIIPYPPGGPTDVVGRIVGQALAERVGQSVIVDNRPGASGMIGADLVAKAAPDGYTIMINVSGQLVNPALYANMTHDPLKDFTPITDVASTPIQLVVSEKLQVRSVADLVKLVRSEPGRHSFASSSTGTPGHLAGELFKSAAKLDVLHVPYKGSAPALTDVMSGQVTYMLDSMPSSINLVKGGRLRALAVTSAQRVDVLPDVPTFAELGYRAVDLTSWYGLWAPAKLPQDIVDRLYAAVSSVLAQDDVKKRFREVMAQGVGDTPKDFSAFCISESRRYAAIVKSAGIKPQ